MSKYKLKYDFAGKQKGDILDFTDNITYSWKWFNEKITVSKNNIDLLELVKNYEIQSYLYETHIYVLDKFSPKNGTFRFGVGVIREETKHHLIGLDIHSVKRLSDDEIFTIGDEYYTFLGVCKIESFKEEDGQIIIISKELCSCDLSSISKVKEQEIKVGSIVELTSIGGHHLTNSFRKLIDEKHKLASVNPILNTTYQVLSFSKLNDGNFDRDVIILTDGLYEYFFEYQTSNRINYKEYIKLSDKEYKPIEPILYTSEHEVYVEGKSEACYVNDKVFAVNYLLNFTRSSFNILYRHDGFKYFKTEQAANDYIKLQKAIKESKLEIGNLIKGDYDNYCTNLKSWGYAIKGEGSFRADESYCKTSNFLIFEDKPCVITNDIHNNSFYYIPLEQFNKPKLIFGDREVTIKKSDTNNKDIIITCGGENLNYNKLKEFRKSIDIIQNFKFGNKKFEGFFNRDEPNTWIIQTTGVKIGCTTGTIEQIDKKLLND